MYTKWTTHIRQMHNKIGKKGKCMKTLQRAKKVVSDSLGLVDFAIGLVNSVINLPDEQVMFFEEFKLMKNCETNLIFKTFWG